jgi:hypothetical protein
MGELLRRRDRAGPGVWEVVWFCLVYGYDWRWCFIPWMDSGDSIDLVRD